MKVHIQVARDKRKGYVASCPSLPGCTCHGNTREEVTAKLIEAIRGYLAALGNIVPESVHVEEDVRDVPPTQVT